MNDTLNDWDAVELADFGEIVAGGTPTRAVPSFWNGGIPWATPSEITELKDKYLYETREYITQEGLESSAARLLPAGTLLVTSRATLGEVAIAGTQVATNQGFKNIVPNEETDSLFAYYQIGTLKREMIRLASGTTFLEISKADFSRIRTLRPRKTEQRRIAAVLDTVDELIAKTEAVIAKLKQVRTGLLHDLLTRGLDDNGQLRPPPAEALHLYKDSPLGPIPREWEVVNLSAVTTKIQDGTHFSPQSSCGPFRYLTSKNVRFGDLDLTDCGWISEVEHREIYRRCDVQKNDVLLTKDGANTGNAALNSLDEEFSLLSSVVLIRCRPGRSDPYFILNYLLSPVGQKRLKDLMSGNAISRLTLQKIQSFLIPMPPFEEQRDVARSLEKVTTTLKAYQDEVRKLNRLKFGLMTDLLTGRVRVLGGGAL